MPLILDDMRREFAQFLADDPATRWRMDAALAHVITLAHQAGLGGAQAMEAKIAVALEALNNPMLEHHEARSAAAAALGDAQPASAEVKPVADDVRGVISRLQSFLDRVIQHSGDGTIHPELYEGDCDTLRDAINHLRHADRAYTPPQQPRQESEIAAEALEANKHVSVIIKALANIVQLPDQSKRESDAEVIRREPVMREVSRIRDATYALRALAAKKREQAK